jgi:hypothetical protein
MEPWSCRLDNRRDDHVPTSEPMGFDYFFADVDYLRRRAKAPCDVDAQCNVSQHQQTTDPKAFSLITQTWCSQTRGLTWRSRIQGCGLLYQREAP